MDGWKWDGSVVCYEKLEEEKEERGEPNKKGPSLKEKNALE